MRSALIYAKLLYRSFKFTRRISLVDVLVLIWFGIVIFTLGLLKGRNSLPRKLLYKILSEDDSLLDILTSKNRKLLFDILTQRESFSKDFQDCLAICFSNIESLNYFIDIGAYDGITKSNSWALERAGYKGFLVEANQTLVDQISEKRSSKVIPCAVVAKDMVGDSFSILIPENARASSARIVSASFKSSSAAKKYDVKLMRTAELLEQFRETFGKDALRNAYVSIDIEGLDLKIFSEILSLGGRPACISIEHNFDRTVMSEIELKARSNGYSIVFPWLTRNDYFLIRNSII